MKNIYPDISHYKTVSDWKLLASETPFIITKATQGTGFVDEKLKEFVDNFNKYKIPYWVYTYLNKGGELAQTKFMVKTCEEMGITKGYFAGYILDAELKNDPDEVLSSIKYLTGCCPKVMLYTMYSQYSHMKSAIKSRGDAAWWEARYGLNNGKYISLFKPHKGVDLLQFSDKGKFPGLSGSGIDLNRIMESGRYDEEWYKSLAYRGSYSWESGKNYYLGEFPTLPARGFYKYGDGISELTDKKSRGEIKKIQVYLGWILGDKVNILVDGKYGKKTREAVIMAQKILGVVADGEFGKKTLKAAMEYRK